MAAYAALYSRPVLDLLLVFVLSAPLHLFRFPMSGSVMASALSELPDLDQYSAVGLCFAGRVYLLCVEGGITVTLVTGLLWIVLTSVDVWFI